MQPTTTAVPHATQERSPNNHLAKKNERTLTSSNERSIHMKANNRLGGILAIIAALMGIIGHFVLFLTWYQIGMHTQAAEPGCESLLKYIHPLMADFGILGGVLFAISAYGYFTKKNWAFFLSVVAIVLALLGSWFINVP